jgi:hypothetical protein
MYRLLLPPVLLCCAVPGVLGLYVRGCGPVLGRRFMLTKTLEWNLYLCILDPMFDEHFHIRQVGDVAVSGLMVRPDGGPAVCRPMCATSWTPSFIHTFRYASWAACTYVQLCLI